MAFLTASCKGPGQYSGLKITEDQGAAFTLQTARPSRGSDDQVERARGAASK